MGSTGKGFQHGNPKPLHVIGQEYPAQSLQRVGMAGRVRKDGMFGDIEGQIRSLSRNEYERLISELPQHLAGIVR